jgi:uncharacterized protein YgbK (DUF1537 family)
LRLGCIADDFTGATDLASTLVRGGMRTVQTIGVPRGAADRDVDAFVLALKSRTIEPDAAVAQSLEALAWLRAGGAEQIYFKICSTFDSTDRGNIGPVTDALMDALGCSFTIACPAFPANRRTVYKGYLFADDRLVSEGSMRTHPLTPMSDPNLVRVLGRQTRRPVGLVDHDVVRGGPGAVRQRFGELRGAGVGIAIVDAISDDDLYALGPALADLPVLTAGSGVALGLPANFGFEPDRQAARLPAPAGASAIISGSCSTASNAQVRDFLERHPQRGYAVDPLRLAAGDAVVTQALAWAGALLGDEPVLIHATASPDQVAAAQSRLGVAQAGSLVEEALAAITVGLVARGVGLLVVAGGETAGACVQALGVEQLRIGHPIDPGVPWCYATAPSTGGSGLHLALKSGNFGAVDFFTRAFVSVT